MFWIVQENLFNEVAFAQLVMTLERFRIPHAIVKVIPFTDGVPQEERICGLPSMVPQPCLVCGSTALAKLAVEQGWTPGVYLNDDFDTRVWTPRYGMHCFNADVTHYRFSEVPEQSDAFFIRPCLDDKSFIGAVMEWDEFAEWRIRVLDLGESYTTLCADTWVSVAATKHIMQEMRLFIVDGQVVTGALYKIGHRVLGRGNPTGLQVPEHVAAFGEVMAERFAPARAFAMDVALVQGADAIYGLVPKVLEINCINSAALYTADVSKLVQALEAMEDLDAGHRSDKGVPSGRSISAG